MFSAGPLNISAAKNSARVGAILLCFFPGQGTGEALRRVLAVGSDGTVLSPAARLPYTWPLTMDQVVTGLTFAV
jgi:beta-glucosidase